MDIIVAGGVFRCLLRIAHLSETAHLHKSACRAVGRQVSRVAPLIAALPPEALRTEAVARVVEELQERLEEAARALEQCSYKHVSKLKLLLKGTQMKDRLEKAAQEIDRCLLAMVASGVGVGVAVLEELHSLRRSLQPPPSPPPHPPAPCPAPTPPAARPTALHLSSGAGAQGHVAEAPRSRREAEEVWAEVLAAVAGAQWGAVMPLVRRLQAGGEITEAAAEEWARAAGALCPAGPAHPAPAPAPPPSRHAPSCPLSPPRTAAAGVALSPPLPRALSITLPAAPSASGDTCAAERGGGVITSAPATPVGTSAPAPLTTAAASMATAAAPAAGPGGQRCGTFPPQTGPETSLVGRCGSFAPEEPGPGHGGPARWALGPAGAVDTSAFRITAGSVRTAAVTAGGSPNTALSRPRPPAPPAPASPAPPAPASPAPPTPASPAPPSAPRWGLLIAPHKAASLARTLNPPSAAPTCAAPTSAIASACMQAPSRPPASSSDVSALRSGAEQALGPSSALSRLHSPSPFYPPWLPREAPAGMQALEAPAGMQAHEVPGGMQVREARGGAAEAGNGWRGSAAAAEGEGGQRAGGAGCMLPAPPAAPHASAGAVYYEPAGGAGCVQPAPPAALHASIGGVLPAPPTAPDASVGSVYYHTVARPGPGRRACDAEQDPESPSKRRAVEEAAAVRDEQEAAEAAAALRAVEAFIRDEEQRYHCTLEAIATASLAR